MSNFTMTTPDGVIRFADAESFELFTRLKAQNNIRVRDFARGLDDVGYRRWLEFAGFHAVEHEAIDSPEQRHRDIASDVWNQLDAAENAAEDARIAAAAAT